MHVIMADENSLVDKREILSKKNIKTSPRDYSLRKRVPPRPVNRENDVYITKKTNFKAQLEKCSNLLLNGEKEIILHGLGAAICRCINLALQLETTFHGTCQIEVNTSTVDLIDDLEPNTDEGDFGSQVRQNSAVHIRVYRTACLESQ